MKKAIINADDFGLSPGVNRGILTAHRDGILTSTTMLVNMAFFDEAVSLARNDPGLAVGIHMSLLWGPPVSDPTNVPSLLEPDGCFPRSLGVLARRYFLRSLSLDDVATEFRSQIRKFLDAGLEPTHVDTHKHVHCLPGIMRTLVSVARELGIDRIRLPLEQPIRATGPGSIPRPGWRPRARRRLVGLFSARGRGILGDAGMRTTDHFVGIEHSDCLSSEVLDFILYNLKEGSTEIMCHPGYIDEEAKRFARIPPHREIELRGLTDPALKQRVADASIRLCSYRDL